MAIAVELTPVGGAAVKCLLACVHLVADSRAPRETSDIVQFGLGPMRTERQIDEWMLVGDFNADPVATHGAVVGRTVGKKWKHAHDTTAAYVHNPSFWTHEGRKCKRVLDYMVTSLDLSPHGSPLWQYSGTTKSDHRLVHYQLTNVALRVIALPAAADAEPVSKRTRSATRPAAPTH